MKKWVFFFFILFLFPSSTLYAQEKSKTVVFLIDSISSEELYTLPLGSASILQGTLSPNMIPSLQQELDTMGISTMIHYNPTQLPSTDAYDVVLISASEYTQSILPYLSTWNTSHRIIITSISKDPLHILWTNAQEGTLISSSTTHRKGLLKQSDLPYLIASYKDPDLYDRIVFHYTAWLSNPIKYVLSKKEGYRVTFYIRYILIAWIFLLFLCMAQILSPKWRMWTGFQILLLPLLSLAKSFLFSTQGGIYGTSLLLLTLGALLSALCLKFHKYATHIYISLCSTTAITIIFLTLTHIQIIYESPIGYNNILVGGRFYGLNNDMIGLLLGSGIGSIFMIGSLCKASYKILFIYGILFFTLSFITFSPVYGANAGGMIATISCMMFFTFTLLHHSKYKYSIWFCLLICFLILGHQLIMWDLRQLHTTHLGRFIRLLTQKQFLTIFHLLVIKSKQFLYYILLPPVNIIFLLQIRILIKVKSLSCDVYWNMAKTIYLFTTLVMIFTNDTGIVGAVFFLMYLIVPISIFKACAPTHFLLPFFTDLRDNKE